MVLFPKIQTILGFSRKFPISDDVPKVNWATTTQVEQVGETAAQQNAELLAQISAAISNIQHGSLIGIGSNDHHDQYHGGSHTGGGSDPLVLPLEFHDSIGTVVAKIDASGNIYAKGRFLKI